MSRLLSIVFIVSPLAEQKKDKFQTLAPGLAHLDHDSKSIALKLQNDTLTCHKLLFEEISTNQEKIRRANLVVIYKAGSKDVSVTTDAIGAEHSSVPIVETMGDEGDWYRIISKLSDITKSTAASPQHTIDKSERQLVCESRYGHFWKVKTAGQQRQASQGDYIKSIRKSLADYSKYSSCSKWISTLWRAATFHLNRHHTDDVSAIIAKIDTGDLNTVSAILTELNKITKKPGFNHTGSLSMRITNIKKHLSGAKDIDQELLTDSFATEKPGCFSRY